MAGADWRPAASLDQLRLRADLLRRTRAFFEARGVLEVDTPLLSAAGLTDPHIESFRTEGAAGVARFLHTSPEFPMKRLLAAGSGPIYQICHVFRQGEEGRLHNPEFSMLEWYRPGWDYRRLMEEVEALLCELLGGFETPFPRLTYDEALRRYAGVERRGASAKTLKGAVEGFGIVPPTGMDEQTQPWLDLLMTHVVEPRLEELGAVFICDYPPTQSALARLRGRGEDAVAERFELYVRGMELANGFSELTDAVEQRARFAEEVAGRGDLGLTPIPMDERLLAALEQGLPESAGVALGFDRLLMLASGTGSLSEVLAFPFERA